MTKKRYQLICGICLVAVLLVAFAIFHWFTDSGRNWSSLLMYIALLLVTGLNFANSRRSYLDAGKNN